MRNASPPPGTSPRRRLAPACPGSTTVMNRSLSSCRCTQNGTFIGSQRSSWSRQGHGEGAALAGLRVNPDPPTVGLDQDAADIQSEAEPRSAAVRPVESIEKMRHVFGVDPWTRILDGD